MKGKGYNEMKTWKETEEKYCFNCKLSIFCLKYFYESNINNSVKSVNYKPIIKLKRKRF